MSLSELQRIKRAHLAALERRERDALLRMVSAYADISRNLQARAEATWALVEEAREAGEDVKISWLVNNARFRLLLEQAERELVTWAMDVGAETAGLQASATREATDAVREELSHLLTPPGEATVVASFNVLPVAALNDLVGALAPGSPLQQLIDEIPAETRGAIQRALITGLAAGDNPRIVGRRVAKASAAGLARGIRIARTEMMRSYRDAHHRNYQANHDVIKGWMWTATLSGRTCAACLAQHGKVFPLTETLNDHPNGRCTPTPVTKTWAELGLGDRGYRETSIAAREIPDGESWFRDQPGEVQTQVLGIAGAAAYQAGRVILNDFVGVKRNRTWGDAIYQRSLADALAAAAKRGQRPSPPPAPATPPAPAPRSGAPAGTPVSTVLKADSRVARLANEVLAAIDRVHGDGVLPEIPIQIGRLAKGVQGAYGSTLDGRARMIQLRTKPERPRLTLAHEIGHFLDQQGLGTRFFASERDVRLERWRTAARNSRAAQALRDLLDQVRATGAVSVRTADGITVTVRPSRAWLQYALSDRELFARSYAQYIALRSGSATMQRELDVQRQGERSGLLQTPTQWDDDDFAPIAEAFDELFQNAGWRT